MKKKIKKVEASVVPLVVKNSFLDNFPVEIKRATTTWLLTIVIFFLILHVTNYDLSKVSGIWVGLILGDVLIGGITFLYILVNVGSGLFNKSTFLRSAISVGIISVILFSFFAILSKLPTLATTTANTKSDGSSTTSNTTEATPPSPIVQPSTTTTVPKPTTKPVATTSTILNDGKTECRIHANCGGGSIRLTLNECNQSICCQVGSTWSFYRDKNKCTEDQKLKYPTASYTPYSPYTYAQPSYPPCEIYYSALGYSQTYNYMTVEACNEAKRNVASTTTNITMPTPTPQPTIDYEYCNGVVADWSSYRESFYANQYNNFSSSAEAIYSLNSSMQLFQTKLNNASCGKTLSLAY